MTTIALLQRPILNGIVRYVKEVTFGDLQEMSRYSHECPITSHLFDDGAWEVVLRAAAASGDEEPESDE